MPKLMIKSVINKILCKWVINIIITKLNDIEWIKNYNFRRIKILRNGYKPNLDCLIQLNFAIFFVKLKCYMKNVRWLNEDAKLAVHNLYTSRVKKGTFRCWLGACDWGGWGARGCRVISECWSQWFKLLDL